MSQEAPQPNPEDLDAAVAGAQAEGETEVEAAEAEAGAEAASTTEAVEQLTVQLAEANDAILRTQAELDNFRKRSRRENEENLKYAQLPLMRDLLAVLDNFHLALQAAEQNADAGELVQGVKMVSGQLVNVLNQHHCHAIESLGQPFDPNLHEAIQMEASTEFAANHVSREVRSGYRLHDRVIRPAQVFVSTGAPSE